MTSGSALHKCIGVITNKTSGFQPVILLVSCFRPHKILINKKNNCDLRDFNHVVQRFHTILLILLFCYGSDGGSNNDRDERTADERVQGEYYVEYSDWRMRTS